MSRLLQEFKLILTRNVPKDKWSLDSLLLAFKEELEATTVAEKGKVITKGQFPVTAQALVAEQVRRRKREVQIIYFVHFVTRPIKLLCVQL